MCLCIYILSGNQDVLQEILNKSLKYKERILMAQLQISVAYFCSIGLYFLV